jgi:pimeloyl-ACP methyl ester carboxylesterase/chloramphenicol 3-O-phosphotransferase
MPGFKQYVLFIIIFVIIAIMIGIFGVRLMNRTPGRLIVLDGVSSSGKSSTIKELLHLTKTYTPIAIDDFVSPIFLEQQNNPVSEAEFLKKIDRAEQAMFKKISKELAKGNNVILDTVLAGLQGIESIDQNLEQMKHMNKVLILVHVPLRVLMQRLHARNQRAQKQNKPEEERSFSIALRQFGATYKQQTQDNELDLGQLSKKEILDACNEARHEFEGNENAFTNFKNNILKNLNLIDNEVIHLTPRIAYDFTITTALCPSHECALKIKDYLENKKVEKEVIRKVKKNNIQLWTESFGKKQNPAMLLIAGAMAPAQFWTDVFCNYLADAGYFVIRYDHRDSGLSSSIDFNKYPYTIHDLLEDTITILDAYKISKAHIVGHSMGGALAQLLAIKHKDRCLSITSISYGGFLPFDISDSAKKILDKTWKLLLSNKPTLDYETSLDGFLKSYKYLNGTAPFDEEMAKSYVKDMYGRSNQMYMTRDNQIKAFEVPHNHAKIQQNFNVSYKDLERISVPTLIIHGQEDYLALLPGAQLTAKTIPESTLIIIPKMGHMIFNRKIEKNIADHIINHIRKSS